MKQPLSIEPPTPNGKNVMSPRTWMNANPVFFVVMVFVIAVWAMDPRRPLVSEPAEVVLIETQRVCAVHTDTPLIAGSSRKVVVNGLQIALCSGPCAQKAIKNLEGVYRNGSGNEARP
jgi:hypothetical protein